MNLQHLKGYYESFCQVRFSLRQKERNERAILERNISLTFLFVAMQGYLVRSYWVYIGRKNTKYFSLFWHVCKSLIVIYEKN